MELLNAGLLSRAGTACWGHERRLRDLCRAAALGRFGPLQPGRGIVGRARLRWSSHVPRMPCQAANAALPFLSPSGAGDHARDLHALARTRTRQNMIGGHLFRSFMVF